MAFSGVHEDFRESVKIIYVVYKALNSKSNYGVIIGFFMANAVAISFLPVVFLCS